MSVEALMIQEVTLRTLTDPGNEIAGTDPTYTTGDTLMYLEPRSGREHLEDRNTPLGDWFGVGYASVAWDSWDQVLYGNHVFDIIAPPRPMFDPLTAANSHVELDLQEIDWTPDVVAPETVGGFSDGFSEGFDI